MTRRRRPRRSPCATARPPSCGALRGEGACAAAQPLPPPSTAARPREVGALGPLKPHPRMLRARALKDI
eukprot:6115193-Pleurochrysis_carterae.AAC.1